MNAIANKKPSNNIANHPLAEVAMGKLMPQAIELEMAVLGALTLSGEAMPFLTDLLTPESFYKESHRLIFAALISLYEQGKPTDMLMLTEELRKSGNLEAVGGAYYIVELTNRVASAANIEYHARIIAQKHIARSLIKTSTNILNAAYDETTDVFELLLESQEQLMNVDNRTSVAVRTSQDAAMDSIKILRKMLDGTESIGVTTGFSTLDAQMSCYVKEDYVVWGARPGVGKTALMLSSAYKQAKAGIPVAIFSLEMPINQLMNRLVCIHTGLNSNTFKNKAQIELEWDTILRALEYIATLPIYFDDATDTNAPEIKNKLIWLQKQKGVQIAYVDYLQLLGWKREDNRNLQKATIVEYNSRVFRMATKKYGIPIIALSQLSRASETRGGAKKPELSDLRETGAIEQDATIVFLLYSAEKAGILEDENGNSTKGIFEILCKKNRSGNYFDQKLAQKHYCYQVDDLQSDTDFAIDFAPINTRNELSETELRDVPF